MMIHQAETDSVAPLALELAARNYVQQQSALAFDLDGAPCIKPAGAEGLVIKLTDVQ
ncbi:MAG: hypothetical protein IAF58_13490 [Leptolyngbya sp.]|nr:hypothetical protein [Candidatus Melainabacteria bacterium]